MTNDYNPDDYDAELVSVLIRTFHQPRMENLAQMLMYSMKFAGGLKDKSGVRKKHIVMASILKVVDDTDMAGELEPVVMLMLPDLIDNLVAVDKNKLVINPRAKKVAYTVASLVKTLFSKCKCNKK